MLCGWFDSFSQASLSEFSRSVDDLQAAQMGLGHDDLELLADIGQLHIIMFAAEFAVSGPADRVL